MKNILNISILLILTTLLISCKEDINNKENNENLRDVAGIIENDMNNTISWSEIISTETQWDSETALKEILIQAYQEEMLARDIYKEMYNIYWNKVFLNISESEQKHMNSVLKFLWEENIPNDYWVYNEVHNLLIEQWKKSLNDALNVWISIEKLDIDDILKIIENPKVSCDIKQSFTKIWWTSFNHMRSFNKNIESIWWELYEDTWDYLRFDKWNLQWEIIQYINKDIVEECNLWNMRNHWN